MHNDDTIDESTGSDLKPEIVTYYNNTKIGVDMSDCLQKNYSVSRIANRWPLSIFFFMMNVGAVNAHIILKENLQKNLVRKEFLYALGTSLVTHQCKRRLYESTVPLLLKTRISEILRIPLKRPAENENAGSSNPQSYGKCHYCPARKNRKTTKKCSLCKNLICGEHAFAVHCETCSLNNSVQ